MPLHSSESWVPLLSAPLNRGELKLCSNLPISQGWEMTKLRFKPEVFLRDPRLNHFTALALLHHDRGPRIGQLRHLTAGGAKDQFAGRCREISSIMHFSWGLERVHFP